MSRQTRIIIPGAIGGVVGALIAAATWLLSNLPASPEPVLWQIVLVSGTTFVTFHIGVTFGERREDDSGTPELESGTFSQV